MQINVINKEVTTMSDAAVQIIISIIGFLGVVITVISGNRKFRAEREAKEIRRDAELDARLDAQNVRLDGIDQRLKTHNDYAKRFTEITADLADVKNSVTKIQTDVEWLKTQ